MEVLLLCFLMSWALTRYGITDAIAASNGTESPRVAERRQRAAHAHERAMNRTGPTIGEAVAGRIADRISHPKPSKNGAPRQPGPARQFAGQLWEDSWAWASDKHQDRMQRRHNPQNQQHGQQHGQAGPQGGAPGPGPTSSTGPSGAARPGAGSSGPAPGPGPGRASGAGPAPGGARPGWNWNGPQPGPGATPGPGRTRTGPADPGAGRTSGTSGTSGTSRGRTGGPQVVDAELVDDEPVVPGPGRHHDVVDGEVVDGDVVDGDVVDEAGDGRPPIVVPPPAALPAGPAPADGDLQDPGAQGTGTQTGTPAGTQTDDPPWASVIPIRKGIPMTTATHTVSSGETLNPTDGYQFCKDMKELAEQVHTSLETSITSLEERGVTGEPIDLLRQMQEAAQVLVGHSETAQSHFERHMTTQDQVASDDTIAGTVEGGYLDAAGR